MTNSIEKSIDIDAPIEKVWDALTDYKKFGEWFGVKIDGPFVVGAVSTGQITICNYEHVEWNTLIVKMDKPNKFSYEWHPFAVEKDRDYSKEPRTLIEFTLSETASGTRVNVIESGFDKLPADRIADALRANTGGWQAQLENIKTYAEK